jgi:phage recombination protein Bet
MNAKSVTVKVKDEAAPVRRLSLMTTVAERFGMEIAAFEATVRANCMPEKATKEQLAAFLIVVNEYGLNPILREIYAMPGRGGAIQTIVGVDGWLTLINRQPNLDGITFEDRHDDKGHLVSITCRIYRKDRAHPTEATEYLAECRRGTDTWKQWPHRMLRHKALIQTARMAFGFAGVMEPDEYERADDTPRSMPSNRTDPPSPPPAPKSSDARHAAPSRHAQDLEPVDATDEGEAPAAEAAAEDEASSPEDGAAEPSLLEQFCAALRLATSSAAANKIWARFEARIREADIVDQATGAFEEHMLKLANR